LPDSQAVIVGDVMVAYLKFAKGYYRKDGMITSEYHLVVEACRAVRPIYGNALASDFGPLALKTVRQTMVDVGHSRKTINKQTDRIKRMFKWSAAEEQIPASIPQALSMVSGLRKGRTDAKEMPPVRPVDDSIVDTTLEFMPTVVADMVRFQRLTGCRPAEVCGLRPCDLDRTEEVWTYRPESHKTEHHDRDRDIGVGPRAQAILLRYLARDHQTFCFRPCDSEAKRRAAATKARKTPLSCGNKPWF
jgi:integrase